MIIYSGMVKNQRIPSLENYFLNGKKAPTATSLLLNYRMVNLYPVLIYQRMRGPFRTVGFFSLWIFDHPVVLSRVFSHSPVKGKNSFRLGVEAGKPTVKAWKSWQWLSGCFRPVILFDISYSLMITPFRNLAICGWILKDQLIRDMLFKRRIK